CHRVPVTARPKYAPKLVLLSLADRCCSPGLSGCASARSALLLRGSECKPSARCSARRPPTRHRSHLAGSAYGSGAGYLDGGAHGAVHLAELRRGPFFCGRSSARPECRWPPPPPSPRQHHAFRPGQPLQDKAIARSAAIEDVLDRGEAA